MFGINTQDLIPYVGYGFLAIFLIVAIVLGAGIYRSRDTTATPKIKGVKGGAKGTTPDSKNSVPNKIEKDTEPVIDDEPKSGGFLSRKRKDSKEEGKPSFAPSAGSASLNDIKETLNVLGASRSGSEYGSDEELTPVSRPVAPKTVSPPTEPTQASPAPTQPSKPTMTPTTGGTPPLPPLGAGFMKKTAPVEPPVEETAPLVIEPVAKTVVEPLVIENNVIPLDDDYDEDYTPVKVEKVAPVQPKPGLVPPPAFNKTLPPPPKSFH